MEHALVDNERIMMAGTIEIRTSGEKVRYVVLSRGGEILSRSAPFEDKSSAKRALSSLTRALNGAEIIDVTRPVELTPAKKAARTKMLKARARKAAATKLSDAATLSA